MAEQLPRLEGDFLVFEGPSGTSYTNTSYIWISAASGRLMVGAPTGALRDPAPAEEAAARQLLDRVAAAG